MPLTHCVIIKTHSENNGGGFMIEFYILEHLTAFYEYGTLSAAAENLHISQPALSRSMKKLEELLNVPLFHHQKNKISLNDIGIKTAEYAKEIIALEKQMVDQVRLYDRISILLFLEAVPLCQNLILRNFWKAYTQEKLSPQN